VAIASARSNAAKQASDDNTIQQPIAANAGDARLSPMSSWSQSIAINDVTGKAAKVGPTITQLGQLFLTRRMTT
jgi:hypothetical protein